MMTGPIVQYPRERVVDRREERLAMAWVRTAVSRPAAPDLSWLHRDDDGRPGAVERGAPMLVMLAGDHPTALAEAIAHGEAGERVYLLVPRSFGKGGVDPRLLACPAVLIRRLPEVPATAVHRVSRARVWFGVRVEGAAPWVLWLDEAQGEALRQIFVRLFWHDAIDEAWTDGKALSFRPVGKRAFEVPVPSADAPVQWGAVDGSHDVRLGGARVHRGVGEVPRLAPARLWFRPGGENGDRLAGLVRKGAVVMDCHPDLPDLTLRAEGSELLLPGGSSRLRVVLNPAQVIDAGLVLAPSTPWRFAVDVPLGAPEPEQVWLPGAAKPLPFEEEQVIELGSVAAESLGAVAVAEPSGWSAPRPLARLVRYRWSVVPPTVPAGAEDDALVGRWQALDVEWGKRLGAVRSALEGAATVRGRIRASLAKWVRGVLGFERTERQLLGEVARLELEVPSKAGPDGARALLVSLGGIEAQAGELRSGLDEAERKGQEDAERERQEVAWQRGVDEAKRERQARQAALDEKRARRSEKTKENAAVEAALAAVEKVLAEAERVEAARAEADRAEAEAAKEAAERAKLDRPQAEEHKQQANHAAKKPAEQAGRQGKKASQPAPPPVKSALSPEVKAARQEKQDRQVMRAKLADEISRLGKDIDRLTAEIWGLDRRVAEPFVFQPLAVAPAPQSKSGGKFVPSATARPAAEVVPDAALPAVGRLRSHRKARYLVIDRWEDLAAGEREATRLSARLVAAAQHAGKR